MSGPVFRERPEERTDREPMAEAQPMELTRLNSSERQRVGALSNLFGLDAREVARYIEAAQISQDGSFTIPDGMEFDENVGILGYSILHHCIIQDQNGVYEVDITPERAGYAAEMYVEETSVMPNIRIDRATEREIVRRAEELGLNGEHVLHNYRLNRALETNGMSNPGYSAEQRFAAVCGANSRTARDGTVSIATRDWEDIVRTGREQIAIGREIEGQSGSITERNELSPTGQTMWDCAQNNGFNPQATMNAVLGLANGQLATLYAIDPDLNTISGINEVADTVRPNVPEAQLPSFNFAVRMLEVAYQVWDVSQFSMGSATLSALITGRENSNITPADRQLFEAREQQFLARVANLSPESRA